MKKQSISDKNVSVLNFGRAKQLDVARQRGRGQLQTVAWKKITQDSEWNDAM